MTAPASPAEAGLILALTDEARAETARLGGELASRQVLGLLVAIGRRLTEQAARAEAAEARLGELEAAVRDLVRCAMSEGGEP